MNLRGVRESGAPSRSRRTSSWSSIIGMAIWGLIRLQRRQPAAGRERRLRGPARARACRSSPAGRGLPAGLRAFSSGCAALTGVEAISNGVPAFRKPKSKNAATTLLLLGTIAVTMLMSICSWPPRSSCGTPRTPRPSCYANGAPVGEDYTQKTGHRPARRRGVLGNFSPGFYLVDRRDRADPGAGREHRVQRLPGARLDPGPGRLPAPPAAHPRRPARLQQRHHPAGRCRDRR